MARARRTTSATTEPGEVNAPTGPAETVETDGAPVAEPAAPVEERAADEVTPVDEAVDAAPAEGSDAPPAAAGEAPQPADGDAPADDPRDALITLQAAEIAALEGELAELRAIHPAPSVPDDPADGPLIPSGQEPQVYIDPTPPEPYVAPETATPGQGWDVGQYAPAARWGIVDPSGNVTPTGRKGLDKPEPGARAMNFILPGDVVTAAVRAAVGLS